MAENMCCTKAILLAPAAGVAADLDPDGSGGASDLLANWGRVRH